ncbi:MAG: pilus assembly protein PilM, partial [bacterium]
MSLLKAKSVGIDIADQTIEIIELDGRGEEANVTSKSQVVFESGVVEKGRIINEEKLAQIVKKTLKSAKPTPIRAKKIIFGLPESQVYIQIITLPSHQKKDREALIKLKANKNIPLAEDDLLFAYKITAESETECEALLVATSKKIVEEWQQFFQKIELEIEVFDIESLATFRGLFLRLPKIPICIVDIGAATTNIAIFDSKGLRYSRTINFAGNFFTAEIAKYLRIKIATAEEKKKTIGLTKTNTRVFPILIKSLETVVSEVRVVIDYFKEKTGENIAEVFLVGGSSKLKGIADYFATNLGLPVRNGKSSLTKEDIPLEYIEATGLAFRGLDKEWSQKTPTININNGRLEKKMNRKEAGKIVLPVSDNNEDSALSSVSLREQEKKLRSEKILLAIILILGLLSVPLSFFYKAYRKEQQKERIKSQVAQYTKTQAFDLWVPVAVSLSEYAVDRVSGRIIENAVVFAGDYDEAAAHSRLIVAKQLEPGESLWLKPISPEQTVFPMTIKWLVFNEREANDLFLKKIDELNKAGTAYSLNNIKKEKIEAQENPNLFFLMAEVTVSLNELIT